MTDALKYSNYDVVFQEVPDEVSLAINITGCPHHCKGCHSPYLGDYFGNNLLNDLDSIVTRYSGLISCVCFMGGDQNMSDLVAALQSVKDKGLKTCVYSGADNIGIFLDHIGLIDYLKIGRYDESLGGLSSQTTNQRFYRIEKSNIVDITERFQKTYL
jgi:anaerobic ribonucleoside-triphosphate reductase activating protein